MKNFSLKMEKQLLIRIEIIQDSLNESEADTQTRSCEYNWMKENTPLLKKLDSAMMMMQQPRFFKVSSLNIGKDDAYYVMNQDKRIDLEHGDILELENHYRVRVSLIHESNRRQLNEEDRLYTQVNKRQFGMKFNTILEGASNVPFKQERTDHQISKKHIQATIHDLVPSTSSFSPPRYIRKENEMQFKKIIPVHVPVNPSIDSEMTFKVNARHMDSIYANYKNNDRNFSQSSDIKEEKNIESLYKRMMSFFKKETVYE